MSSRLVSSAALLWAGNQLLRVLQLATVAILARILTPSDYGVVALASTVIGLLEVATNMQLNGGIIRTQKLEKAHLDSAFTLALLRGLGLALVIVLSAHAVATHMKEPRLEPVLYVMAGASLITALANPYFVLFERNLDFRREVLRNAAGAIIGNGVGIVAAIVLRSYWALIAGAVATSLVTTLLSYVGSAHRPGLSLAKARELFGFGSWLMIVNIMNYANTRLDYLIIGRGLGSAKLGAYHVGQQVTMFATGDVVGPISRALFPAFAMMAGDTERLRASYRRAQGMMVAIALPIGCGISAVASDVIFLLVGAKWGDAVPVIRFLAPLVALQTTSASIEAVAMAMGRSRALFVRTLIFLIVRGACMGVGFWLGGFLGVVYGRVVSGVFAFAYGLGLAASLTGSRWFDPLVSAWRSIISALVMWALVALLPWDPNLPYALQVAALAGKIALGALCYVGLNLLLWRVVGRPEGVETQLMAQGAKVLSRLPLRPRRA